MNRSSLRVIAAAIFAIAATFTLTANAQTAKSTYCVRSQGTDWTRQDFQPLIQLNVEQTIAKVTYEGSTPRTVKLRKFTPDYQVSFEYTLDDNGKVIAVSGAVNRWNKWVFEATSFHQTAKGLVPAEFQYSKIAGGLSIPEPADGRTFAAILDNAPAFQNLSDMPCAVAAPSHNSQQTMQLGQ